MTEINIEVRGLIEAQKKLEQVAADLHGAPIMKAMRDATLVVTRSARIYAPVDTGRLRASITPEVRIEGQEVVGVVGSNVTYAPYMEMGTGVFGKGARHWPPAGALETWAARHGFDSGYQVARIIGMRGGLEGRRFLQRGFEENREKIIGYIENAVEGIVKK